MPTPDSRANPLAHNTLQTRSDVQQAVRDLYEPLVQHVSPGGARVRLGTFGALFEPRVAELEGFARPLYGIVPLTVGGGDFEHWDLIVSGLDGGSDPESPEYWGPVVADGDQRMVEQASIGVALAFCPDATWEALDMRARRHLADWLQGIFEYDPAPNNWQFFRVLVALGLERVGVVFDRSKVERSLGMIESYRRGRHWYVDGARGSVDYYVPWAFHTFGLVYAAANRLGLGDDKAADTFREAAAGFAVDFQHWFAPDGAGVPFGRSLTYRFAMGSLWGALAWADVEPDLSWGEVKGLSLRHLRWWADKPVSDRDGVLPIGFTYDNRKLCESYNSAGSPYWCMMAFGALAARESHPFWGSDEEPLTPLDAPLALPGAGWVVTRDDVQATALVARRAEGVVFADQAAAKYQKFAYSTAFGFSADGDGFVQAVTDSMLALTDAAHERRVRSQVDTAGVEGDVAWSTWRPWDDVRVDTVCWAVSASWHGRLHRVRTARQLTAVETGFAVGYDPVGWRLPEDAVERDVDRAVVTTRHGASALFGFDGRDGRVWLLPVNANLLRPHTAVPVLRGSFDAGDHRLSCVVFASPTVGAPADHPSVPHTAVALLERVSER